MADPGRLQTLTRLVIRSIRATAPALEVRPVSTVIGIKFGLRKGLRFELPNFQKIVEFLIAHQIC